MRARPLALAALAATLLAHQALAHCQVPCGIYGDDARYEAMREDATTIEKAMKEIEALSGSIKIQNLNQAVRWVTTKEQHAQSVQDVAAQYFLAQRIKAPAESAGQARYVKQLAAVHQVTVAAMKCKQTTDLAHVAALRAAIEALHQAMH